MSKKRLTRLGLVLVLLGVCAGDVRAQDAEFFEALGFHPSRDYAAVLPFERVDVVTGSLVLQFTDLVLPGNAGRELRFQHTYNSKPVSGLWTFGLAGVPMKVIDSADWAAADPSFVMADGGGRTLSFQALAVGGNLRYMGNDEFWVYDREARRLWTPDGITYDYDSSGTCYI